MKTTHIIQIAASFGFFLILLFVNWYQGSGLTDDPSEWSYTAKFTQLFHGGIPNDYHELSQFDFFVYSAKFYPKTFWMMVLSLVYFVVISFVSFRQYKRG